MKILQSDKEHILSLHERNKTEKMVLKEQMGDIKTKLQSMIDDGRVTDAVGVVEFTTTNPDRKYAIKKKSKSVPGTFVYLYHDFKWSRPGPDGKLAFGDGVWTPASPAPKPVTPPSGPKEDLEGQIQAYRDKKFVFYNELKPTPTEDELNSQYDVIELSNKQKMYRHKKIAYKGSTGTQETRNLQNEFTDKFRGMGYIPWGEVEVSRRNEYQAVKPEEIDSEAANVFPPEVRFYITRTDLANLKRRGKSDLQTQMESETPSRQVCKEKVNEYHRAFKQGFSVNNMAKEKFIVQRCKDIYGKKRGQNRGDWGMFGAEKLDDKLEELSSNRLRNSPFKLN